MYRALLEKQRPNSLFRLYLSHNGNGGDWIQAGSTPSRLPKEGSWELAWRKDALQT